MKLTLAGLPYQRTQCTHYITVNCNYFHYQERGNTVAAAAPPHIVHEMGEIFLNRCLVHLPKPRDQKFGIF